MVSIVASPDASIVPTELLQHCRAHLSAFKVPRYLEIRDDLPMTVSHKVRKEVLKEGWSERIQFDRGVPALRPPVASTSSRSKRNHEKIRTEMRDASPTNRYFEALVAGDGLGAASLFTADGVLDDLRGGHHAGRDSIRVFIDNRPDLKVDILSEEHRHGRHVTVYGLIHYGSGEEANVRWSFTEGAEGLFDRLVNSRVDRLPHDRLR